MPMLGQNVIIAHMPGPTGFGFGSPEAIAYSIATTRGPVPTSSSATPAQSQRELSTFGICFPPRRSSRGRLALDEPLVARWPRASDLLAALLAELGVLLVQL